MEQGSAEWIAARLGKLTASRLHEAIARTKSGWGASRANLMATLIAERLTGVPQDAYTNAAMIHGIETEPDARTAYEFMTDCDVGLIGFIGHPTIEMSGCSPDGHVGLDGLIEIKCPSTATHIDTLLSGKIPEKYITQMTWQMACTGRKWCDFVSFDPRMPESMRLYIRRIERDDALIKSLEGCVIEFLKELDLKLFELNALYAAKTQEHPRQPVRVEQTVMSAG